MPAPLLSVIVCAHNPRADHLTPTLDALRAQSLPLDSWELLLIDNASAAPLAARLDLAWHPRARHLREDRLGLTFARLCGIAAATGELIVFVDDDNLLAPDYLAAALAIARRHPCIGAWGGRVEPVFEIPPPAWLQSRLFVDNPVARDIWSNSFDPSASTPCGAGLCLRPAVAARWAANVPSDPRRAALGRAGVSLASCEDWDLAFTACDLGLGAGVFTGLHLRHLIPRERLTEAYAVRLVEAIAASQVIMRSLRETVVPDAPPSWKQRLRWALARWRLERPVARMFAAERRGRARGFAQLAAFARSAA